MLSLDDEYPTLTAMLDAYLRPLGDGDEAAMQAFCDAEGEMVREQVAEELARLLAAQHDPEELRAYVAIHRFDLIPDGGAREWLEQLARLLGDASAW